MLHSLYIIASGPLALAAMIACVLGFAWRMLRLYALARRKDRAVFVGFRPGFALASIARWLLPLNRTAAASPAVTAVGFVFHGALLFTALFLSAHVVLLDYSFGIAYPALPDALADGLTLAVLAGVAFYAGRRLAVPEVRALTGPSDWLALALAALPFLTGFCARLGLGGAELMPALHALAGDALLFALPFTRLSHALTFFASRAITGSDFGKRRVGAW